MDGKGYNFLHTAVKNADLEAVLFLLSIHIDLNIPTNDADRFMPLHLAAASGHEMIVRNLVSGYYFSKEGYYGDSLFSDSSRCQN